MNRIVFSTTLTLAAATSLTVRGADSLDDPNRFSIGPRFGFNFKADFGNTSGLFQGNAGVNPGPAAAGADHTYNDGYVRLDSSGNNGGLTWNWGYQNASQVVGDTMQFHARQSTGASGASGQASKDDPQYGVELIYQRLIGPIGASGRWGIETGFGYTDLELRGAGSSVRSTRLITDSFPLNGVLPPGPGYKGTFVGPGALLGDTPTRSIAFGSSSSSQKLSGQMFSIRLGPFAEWNLSDHISLGGSVGLTVAPAKLSFDFSETERVGGGGSSVTAGHSSKSDFLYGPYISAVLRYDFSDKCGIYVGAQFQSLTDFKESIGNRTARLDQEETIYATVGATWKF